MRVHESMRLYVSKSAYLFEPSYLDPSKLTENLVIDRESGFLRRNVPAIPATAQEGVIPVFGIFGILRVFSGDVLIVVTGRERVGILMNGKDVWRVTKTQILPFARTKLHLSDAQAHEEEQYLRALKKTLDTDLFYFAYTWDISHAFQQQVAAEIPLWQSFDLRFYFNRNLQRRMIELTMTDPDQNLSNFILPIMGGFASIKELQYSGHKFIFALISRRGALRLGTRYFSRGIDMDGNVSNFVETEQILVHKETVYSHVQIRGSIPLFWKQVINIKYQPELVVHSSTATIEAMKKHFDDLKATYGNVICFSLVNKKGYELSVGSAFTDYAKQFTDIIYNHFDFHYECRKMQWHRISILLNEYENELNDQGYFVSDGGHVNNLQTSVVRTNCMDCLDRTNVVQSELARMVITRQLRQAGIFPPKLFLNEVEELNHVFKNDNADAVSSVYSGTGALKTDFTRTGKRSKAGAIQDAANSALRYIKNNFLDGPRQDVYDLVSGRYELSAARNIPSDEKSIRYYAIPLIIAISFLMLFFTFTYQLAAGTEGRIPLVFWSAVLVGGLRMIVLCGHEFVSVPRLVNPYNDQLMQKYRMEKIERSKKPSQL